MACARAIAVGSSQKTLVLYCCAFGVCTSDCSRQQTENSEGSNAHCRVAVHSSELGFRLQIPSNSVCTSNYSRQQFQKTERDPTRIIEVLLLCMLLQGVGLLL